MIPQMNHPERCVSDPELIRAMLGLSCVCTVAMRGEDYPYQVPMNFGFVWEEALVLYLHAAERGYKSELLARDNRVCVNVHVFHDRPGQKYRGDAHDYRSVTIFGRVEQVTEMAEYSLGCQRLQVQSGRPPSPPMGRPVPGLAIWRVRAEQVTAKAIYPIASPEEAPIPVFSSDKAPRGEVRLYTCRRATREDLERIWEKDLRANGRQPQWLAWREEYLAGNARGDYRTYVVRCGEEPVGQGTLLLSPDTPAIRGRTALADGRTTANVNALRIEPAHEGRGHISRLVRLMEEEARGLGCARVTIGVEARESRNLGIYLHWGYSQLVHTEVEYGQLLLYYAKAL